MIYQVFALQMTSNWHNLFVDTYQFPFADDVATLQLSIEQSNEIQNDLWHEYDRKLMAKWRERQRKLEERQRLKEAQRARIVADFEAEQRQQKEKVAEVQRMAEERQMRDAILLGEIQQYINADGPMPIELQTPQELNASKPLCTVYEKVGICRNGLQCSRNHIRPRISQVLLIANFFTHIRLNNLGGTSEYGDDIGMEFDDDELQTEFETFFADVVPEFEKFGQIVQFRVCQNRQKHLRGNVYVEFNGHRYANFAYVRCESEHQLITTVGCVFLFYLSETRCEPTKTCRDDITAAPASI